ncbi:hypothetical protein ACLMJK_006812 [Lecanora helva]
METQGGDNYPSFDPTVFKTASPIYGTGNVSTLEFYQDDGPTSTVYGKTIDRNNAQGALCYAVNLRGYFVPPTTGEYTITLNADDIVMFWVGATAYSGWTRPNANLESVIFVSNNAQLKFTLEQGVKTPFRIVFGNCPSNGILQVRLIGPGGEALIDSSGTVDATAVITDGCAGDASAPPFAPFGSET